jgi:hypothetical protein
MNKKSTDQVWMLIHGELTEDEEEAVLAEMASDEDRIRAFHARNALDLALREAFGEQAAAEPAVRVARHAERERARGRGAMLAFPGWQRWAQVAAVLAVVAGMVSLLVPRGDVRWERTQLALLDQDRGPGGAGESMLHVPTVKHACKALQHAIDGAYAPASATGTPARWKLRLWVSEHARGALEVRVEGEAGHLEQPVRLEEQRYPDVVAFQADSARLTKSVIAAMNRYPP